MSASTIQQASILNGRQLMLVVVVGLHALVIGALMTMRIVIDPPHPPPAFKPVTSVDPVPPDPPQLRPKLEPTEVRLKLVVPAVLPPNIPADEYKPAPLDVGANVDPSEVLPGAGAGNDAGSIVDIPATEVQYLVTRSPDDYYPAVSLQLQEQGTSVVRVCVAPSGRLEGLPVTARSSGSRRLDAAAIKWAREAAAFTPATRNGAAVSACKDIRVNFTLR